MSTERSLPRLRIMVIGVGIFILSIIILGRLFSLQILNQHTYKEKATNQYSSLQTDGFDRGAIYFTKRDGTHVVGASTTVGYKIAVNTKLIKNKEEIYEKLNEIIPINKTFFYERVNKENDPYEEIAFKLSKEQADKVRSLKISGVDVFSQTWRSYPGGRLGSKLLGFVAYNGDTLTGRYGLERQYDEILRRDVSDNYSNFFAEIFNTIRGVVRTDSQKKEGSIITTIEPVVQQHIEDTLREISSKWNVDSAGAIVMNPKTGEILAFASLPDYDVNEFNNVKSVSTFNNPLVENVFELGSVVKALTMSAGLDAGVVTPQTTYNDKGYVILNTERINNFDGKVRGVVSMQDVLNNSLNTGATFVMQQLGSERFKAYMMKFGIGEKTGIDLPGEVKNLISNLKSSRDIEYATASFGQGIALTPISAIRAFGVLANNGYMVTPHFVSRIEYPDGTSDSLTPEIKNEEILKPETVTTIATMLTTVIDKGMFGGREKLEHYTVAAKTGTAQVARPDGKGYYPDIYLHSMFGYYPAYDPQFITLFYVVNPKGVDYALNTIGKLFMKTAAFLLNYYEVPPDR